MPFLVKSRKAEFVLFAFYRVILYIADTKGEGQNRDPISGWKQLSFYKVSMFFNLRLRTVS